MAHYNRFKEATVEKVYLQMPCKIEKAKNYSDSSKQRGIVQRKQINAVET